MANIFDYINWRGNIMFEQVGINEIDSLIFSELAYLPYENLVSSPDIKETITISELSKKYFELYDLDTYVGAIIPGKEISELLNAVKDTKRYSGVKVWGYVNCIDTKIEKQFSAICFDITDNETYVAYRGTDDTLVGWKENLNMALFTPIPSQIDGVEYLNKIATKSNKKLYLGGHSKGGNLAIYSLLFADKKVKNKVLSVHSFDGPGFKADFIASIENKDDFSKITTFVPSASTVGMIFNMIGAQKIIASSQKGLKQHDSFSWGVMADEFVVAEKLKKSSIELHDLLIKWVEKMSKEEVTDFVESLYKISTSTDASTLTEINAEKIKFIFAILKMDSASRKSIAGAIHKLLKEKRRSNTEKRKAKKKTKKELPKE